MKILADENIPFVKELFGPLGEIKLKKGREIVANDVRDRDVLLVRSVTAVNRALLEQSTVKFVGTCTIGVDHLDISYLEDKDIVHASAPGCNASAVAQYVLSILAALNRLNAAEKKAVIVGGGNVGSEVYRTLSILGFCCSCVDPFITLSRTMRLANLEVIKEGDIICLHTPLTRDGLHPTYHMLSLELMAQLKDKALLINAGRGGVIDNKELESILTLRPDLDVVLDVWENEPHISPSLLKKLAIGTPHIAGYSFDGRVKGSLMIFDALCRFMEVNHSLMCESRAAVEHALQNAPSILKFSSLSEAILRVYDVRHDYSGLLTAKDSIAETFDCLRKNYPKRREFSHYILTHTPSTERELLKQLGFQIG